MPAGMLRIGQFGDRSAMQANDSFFSPSLLVLTAMVLVPLSPPHMLCSSFSALASHCDGARHRLMGRSYAKDLRVLSSRIGCSCVLRLALHQPALTIGWGRGLYQRLTETGSAVIGELHSHCHGIRGSSMTLLLLQCARC
jgi:hypothetical protein